MSPIADASARRHDAAIEMQVWLTCLLFSAALCGCATAPVGERFELAASPAENLYREGLASLAAAGARPSLANARPHVEQAGSLFGRAVEADPKYAPALAALAETHLLINITDEQRLRGARELAHRAISASPGNGRAHGVLGWLHFFQDLNYRAARISFRRALSIDPDLAFSRWGYGLLLASQGEFDAALQEIERAERSRLIRPSWRMGSHAVLFFARRYDEAEARALKPLPGSPSPGPDYFWAGNARLQRGDPAGAIAALEARAAQSRMPGVIAALAAAYAHAGRVPEAAALRLQIDGLMQENARRGQPQCARLPCHMFATAYLAAGDSEIAMRLLLEARKIGQPGVWAVWTKVDPRLDQLRRDPRFRDVLAATGFGD